MFGYNSFNAIKLYLISDFLKETQDQVRLSYNQNLSFFPATRGKVCPQQPSPIDVGMAM